MGKLVLLIVVVAAAWFGWRFYELEGEIAAVDSDLVAHAKFKEMAPDDNVKYPAACGDRDRYPAYGKYSDPVGNLAWTLRQAKIEELAERCKGYGITPPSY